MSKFSDNTVVGIILFAIIGAILLFGINFPIPWDDESYFVFQALSFANHNSLLTPELSIDRNIMWMQPGYMIALGIYFKFIEFSLSNARLFSLFFYTISIVLFIKSIKSQNKLIYYIIVASVALIPSSLVSGNVARMECITLFLGFGMLIFLQAKRFIPSIALLLLSGLIHFNGLYFALPIILAMIFHKKGLFASLRAASLLDRIMVFSSIFLVGFYLFYIEKNIDAFKIDMAYQFSRKFGREPLFHNLKSMILLAIPSAVAIYSFKIKKYYEFLYSSFALAMFLIYTNGQEMWYIVFRNIGMGLLVFSLVGLISNNRFKYFVATFCITGIIISSGLSFSGMRPNIFEANYIDEKFENSFKNEILKFKGDRNTDLTTSFNITGVDLIFYSFLKENNINIVHRMPSQIIPVQPVDICVFITRSQDPDWLKNLSANQYPNPGLCRLGAIISSSNEEIKTFSKEEYYLLWVGRKSHE